jgi:hypothetical protein
MYEAADLAYEAEVLTIHVERSTRFIERRANGAWAERNQRIDQDCASFRGEYREEPHVLRSMSA